MTSSDIRIDVDFAGALADLEEINHQLGRVIETTIREHGHHLQNQVRINASTGNHGPRSGHIPGTGPGPNVATGDYRRSIALTVSAGSFEGHRGIKAEVHTNSVQANRLEYGFVGVDALGRVYRQSPFPHWKPAADAVEARFQIATAAAIDAVIAEARGGSSG